MATNYTHSVKLYPVPSGVVTHICKGCGKEVLTQYSYKNNRPYIVDVITQSGQRMTARNLFHQCTAPKQPPLPFNGDKLNVAEIQKLFDRAVQHLKYPKIRLQTSTGQPVVLYRAGSNSKYFGQIQVTDGGHFGIGKYFGRIDTEGNYHSTQDSTPEVVSLLQELSKDPAGVASKYGKLTGNCCFCGLPLSDKRSTDVGYGPVCADHYGLPWG